MSPPELIAFAVALFIGVPSMLKNWTAVGLVTSFAILEGLYAFGQKPPLEIYILCDFIVITIMFLKGPPIEQVPASKILDQAKTIWLDLSRADKIILMLFLPCWLAYAMSGGTRYWTLWTLGLLQFFVASAEAFVIWRRGRTHATSEAHPADWFSRQRYVINGR